MKICKRNRLHGNRSKLLCTHDTTGVTRIHFGINPMDLFVLFCYSLTYNQSFRFGSLFVGAFAYMHGTLFYYAVLDNIIHIFFFLHRFYVKIECIKIIMNIHREFRILTGLLFINLSTTGLCRTRIHKIEKPISYFTFFTLDFNIYIYIYIYIYLNEWMNSMCSVFGLHNNGLLSGLQLQYTDGRPNDFFSSSFFNFK